MPISECLERDDRMRVLHAGNSLHLFIDEVADIDLVLDIELHQQVVVAGRRIDFRGDLCIGASVRCGAALPRPAQ